MRVPRLYQVVGFALAPVGLFYFGCTGPVVLATSPDAAATSSSASGSNGGASSGLGTSPGTSSSSSSSAILDASSGVAEFAFIVNGVVQTPTTCPSEHWEFPPPAQLPDAPTTFGGPLYCGQGGASPGPPCPGVQSVVIANSGQVPLAYFAASTFAAPTIPGILQGDAEPQLVGVLDPGGQVDISSVFVGGEVAVLGSSQPFSGPDASYASDEGVIPWPKGVAGSLGSSQMNVAQIDLEFVCSVVGQSWL